MKTNKDKRPVNWMTLIEATEYLSISKETMYRLIYKNKKFPARRIGKVYRFKAEELDEWVRSQC